MWKRVHDHLWREGSETVNFGYLLFAAALIWICGLAYLGD
jgi:hypothetical protein